jgi:thiamine biosynthesis protein ThiI
MKRFLLLTEGEISLKKRNRCFFENILINNTAILLDRYSLNILKEKRGRFIVYLQDNDKINHIIKDLSNIFGFKNIYSGTLIERDIDLSVRTVLDLLKDYRSFKIQARRIDKTFHYTSMDLNKILGEKVLAQNPALIVDVHNPDSIVYLDVFNDHFKIYIKVSDCPGGLPYGSSGKAICLLSAGIDSPVAFYMMAKRGCEVIPVYFHTPPYTGDSTILKVENIVQVLSNYTVKEIKLYIVNFTDLQMAIKKYVREKYFTIIARRAMGRIAQELAKKENAKAMITGESLSQVASQTIDNIVCIEEVFDLPVFRPLIGFDKLDIINIAKKIGTYENSIQEGIDCCALFSPKSPETKAKISDVLDQEIKLSEHIDLYRNYSYTYKIISNN